jgi:regulator of protease activity HflC (stomatin/prohibitin superfamily)
VENGHIGIKKQFGSLVGTTPEGFVNFPPWQSVDQVSVRNEIRTYHMDDRSGGGDASSGSAVSADSQPVFLDIQVNYSLVQAGAVDLYRETGGQYVQRILDPAVFQDVKEVTAKYKAIDFAKNREKIRLEIEEKLQGEVGRVTTKDGKQLEAIRINNVALKNVDFTEALSKAIEQTVEAEQQAKREQARVQIVSAQADQAVALATGEKLSAIQRAQGTAQSTLIQARADATANRLRSRTLSPILVQNNAIEKLNPNVSVIICPPRTTCFPGVTNPPVAGG